MLKRLFIAVFVLGLVMALTGTALASNDGANDIQATPLWKGTTPPAASKALVFYTDGDGQFDLGEMPPLLDLIEDCDIVSCYRLDRKDPLMRKLNAWCWTRLVCFLFDLKLRDIDCAFKLYRRAVFTDMPLYSTGALIDTEVLARAARKGCRIVQHGVHHFPRTSGEQTGANLRVVLRAFKELFQLRRRILRGH